MLTPRVPGLLLAMATSLLLTRCSPGIRSFTWVDEIPRTEISGTVSGDYTIAEGDLLGVRVYNQDALSSRSRVRPDGRIGVPLAGEIEALGRRPADLAKEIEARLKPFIVAPAVVVVVEEIQPVRIAVLGEVAHPGVFVLEPGASVLQALATAGGTTEFADRERIFVIRPRAAKAPLTIRFSYARLVGTARASSFALANGDVVTVE
jgi:polysaccharide export outer membrane protein